MSKKQASRRNYLIYVLLALVTVGVYQQVRGFDFIAIDDYMYASENQHVLDGISAKSLGWAFTTNYSANWHPLTWVSLMADAQVARRFVPGFARHPSAGVFHVTNAALHVLNTLLLFAALFAMTGARWRSAFVAALFALHPLHVESVAWVSERKDVLSTLFWMLTMLGYAAYAGRGEGFGPSACASSVKPPSESFAPTRTRSARLYVLTLGAFALGLMAKPMLVSLPLVMLLLDVWPLRRLGRTALRQAQGARPLLIEKAPFFVLAAASCVVTLWAQRASGAIVELQLAPLGERLANAAVSTIAYIGEAISPLNLAMFYPYPGPTMPVWHMVSAVLAIVAGCVIAVACARRYRVVTVGWFWYLITLLPVIGIVQVGSQAMADRYTYVPLLGLFIAATWGAADAFDWAQSRFKSFLLTASAKRTLALAVLAGLAVTSYFQVGYWRNSISLSEHAISVTKNNYFAHAMLGSALHKVGRDDEALQYCVESIHIRRDYSEGHYWLGVVLAAKKLLRGAEAHFRIALRTDPRNPDIHNDLGCVLGRLGDYAGAAEEFSIALRIDPGHENAAKNLRALLSQTDTGAKAN